VELLDVVLVAEAVAPPAAQIVDALALHAVQQLSAAARCAHQLLLLLGLCLLGRHGAVLRHMFGEDGDAAEVAPPVEHHALVRQVELVVPLRRVRRLPFRLREVLRGLRCGRRGARAVRHRLRQERRGFVLGHVFIRKDDLVLQHWSVGATASSGQMRTCGNASRSSKTLNECGLASAMRKNAGSAQKFLMAGASASDVVWKGQSRAEAAWGARELGARWHLCTSQQLPNRG
jgi:hypothetical protein